MRTGRPQERLRRVVHSKFPVNHVFTWFGITPWGMIAHRPSGRRAAL
jgi:hypothetical protein